MNEPITCYGSELFAVCAGLRQRGMVIEKLEAGVEINSGYRVSYFERVSVQVGSESASSASNEQVPGKREAASLNPSPHQVKIPAKDIALQAVKSEVAPRDPSNGLEIPRHRPASDLLEGAETVGVENSIQDRLAALQARMVSIGKIKRPTPATRKPARIPYKDD